MSEEPVTSYAPRMDAAINFLQDAIEYLRGRDGEVPDVEAALDAISEATSCLAQLRGE